MTLTNENFFHLAKDFFISFIFQSDLIRNRLNDRHEELSDNERKKEKNPEN